MIVKVTGDSGTEYTIDTAKVTCTCPNFKYRCSHYPITSEERICKHLGRYYNEHPELKPIALIRAEENQERLASRAADDKIRYPRSVFDPYVKIIRDSLNSFDEIDTYEICGSYRRQSELVSDLDVLICLKDGNDAEGIFNYFGNFLQYVEEWRGPIKAAYLADGFVHIDFKIVPKDSWVFAMMHFTGSKYENIELRRRAHSMGYKLNEYGLFMIENDLPIENLDSEQAVYEFLGVPFKYPWQR
jgi:DNA polymerase/3'-5' exonuclease PolX